MICKWLQTFSIPETLLSLIKVALQDRRLLLLVDGLDEWNNEIAARTALDQLETIVKTHNVSAILTGRPLGVSRLGGLGHPWRTTELALLSKVQQQKLAEIWFNNSQQLFGKENTTRQALVRWQIDNFFKDLQDGGQLQDISSTPLLLTGLISLRVRQVNLPRNRFQVYEELTKLLLEVHPQARSSAASATQQRFEILSDYDIRRKVLGKLAYEIRIVGADNGFSKRKAESILVNFLKDDDVLGLSAERARKGSQEILAVNAETTGILIEKSPDEVGFIHAVFEEYLTATHISSFALDYQLKLVLKKCSDPRWRNIILSLFYQLNRTDEIDGLIAAIENADIDIIGDIYRHQLLAEAAFGNNRCPPKTAKRIAQGVFDKIDFGYWMPERRSLIKYALMDRTADSLKELQSEQLARWYPETQWSRQYLFEALSSWEKEPSLGNALWRGLFDTEVSNRRGAAKALAKVYGQDKEVKQKLLNVLKQPHEPEITATLLFALTKGWPEIDLANKFINISRNSESYDLQLEAVLAAVNLGIHTKQDRDLLLKLSHRSNKNYFLKDEIVNALIKGWPNDSAIFEACWEAWPHQSLQQDAINNDIAQNVLLLGYASNERVIEYLCNLFNSEKNRVSISNEPWEILKKYFTKHPIVTTAIDNYIERLEKESFNEREIALAAQISQSSKAKNTLLEYLNIEGSFPHWVVWGLLETWGMADSEVSQCLISKINMCDLTYLGRIAHLLPDIIQDKAICKKKLLEITKLDKVIRPDFLVNGFAKLGVNYNDSEVIDLLITLSKTNSSLFNSTFELINAFPLDNRIRKLAIELIEKHDASLSVIARNYPNDVEIKTAILNQLTPLPIRANLSC